MSEGGKLGFMCQLFFRIVILDTEYPQSTLFVAFFMTREAGHVSTCDSLGPAVIFLLADESDVLLFSTNLLLL